MKRLALVLGSLIIGTLILSIISVVPGRDRLPCFGTELKPGNRALYCVLGRNYVRDGAVDVIEDAQAAVQARYGSLPTQGSDESSLSRIWQTAWVCQITPKFALPAAMQRATTITSISICIEYVRPSRQSWRTSSG